MTGTTGARTRDTFAYTALQIRSHRPA